jgi:hypothetical protein
MNRFIIRFADWFERRVYPRRAPLLSRIMLCSFKIAGNEALARWPVHGALFSPYAPPGMFGTTLRVKAGDVVELQFENCHWLPVAFDGILWVSPRESPRETGGRAYKECCPIGSYEVIAPGARHTFSMSMPYDGFIESLMLPLEQPKRGAL